MKKVSRNALVVLSAILLLGGLALWIWPGGRPEYMPGMETSMHHASMESIIRNAKTPADHEALARLYDSAALRLDSYASRQEELATLYAAPVAGRRPFQNLAMHFSNIAKDQRAAAAEYRELAKEHREFARTAK